MSLKPKKERAKAKPQSNINQYDLTVVFFDTLNKQIIIEVKIHNKTAIIVRGVLDNAKIGMSALTPCARIAVNISATNTQIITVATAHDTKTRLRDVFSSDFAITATNKQQFNPAYKSADKTPAPNDVPPLTKGELSYGPIFAILAVNKIAKTKYMMYLFTNSNLSNPNITTMIQNASAATVAQTPHNWANPAVITANTAKYTAVNA